MAGPASAASPNARTTLPATGGPAVRRRCSSPGPAGCASAAWRRRASSPAAVLAVALRLRQSDRARASSSRRAALSGSARRAGSAPARPGPRRGVPRRRRRPPRPARGPAPRRSAGPARPPAPPGRIARRPGGGPAGQLAAEPGDLRLLRPQRLRVRFQLPGHPLEHQQPGQGGLRRGRHRQQRLRRVARQPLDQRQHRGELRGRACSRASAASRRRARASDALAPRPWPVPARATRPRQRPVAAARAPRIGLGRRLARRGLPPGRHRRALGLLGQPPAPGPDAAEAQRAAPGRQPGYITRIGAPSSHASRFSTVSRKNIA